MLILGVKLGETISINDNIKIKLVKMGEGNLRIAIDAPKEMSILREGVEDDRTKVVNK